MDEKSRLEYYNQFVTAPELWKFRAGELAHAAEVLYQRAISARDNLIKQQPKSGSPEARSLLADMSMEQTAYMLAGFAIENAIKGILFKQIGGDPSDSRAKKYTRTHDLKDLAKKITNVGQGYDGLLEKLTEFIVWLGRYPRPIKPDTFWKEDRNTGALQLTYMTSEDWTTYNKLFADLILRF
jgi:HEPN domain-containing protein